MATEDNPEGFPPSSKYEDQKEKGGVDRRRFSGKTAWVGLPLFIQIIGVIAVPLLIGLVLYQFTVQQQHDLAITVDLQHQTILQNYLEHMSDLLLKENLRVSKQGDVVRQVAEEQTLTALQNLDPTRKGIIVRFLYESGLIFHLPTGESSPIIDLNTADLSTADLHGIGLSGADLSGAHLNSADLGGAHLIDADLGGAHLDGARLNGTDLGGAHLSDADLSDADLRRAFLRGADLSYVDLRGAHLDGADLSYVNLLAANVTQEQLNAARSLQSTIMPDGLKHP